MQENQCQHTFRYLHLPGHLNSSKKLLELGAVLDTPDHSGRTPLHMAAFKGKASAMKYICTTFFADIL